MKRNLTILLLICMCVPLFGCHHELEQVKKPVTFYYCRTEFDHGNEDSVILGETRESADFEKDLIGLIDLYLQGPISEGLDPTFPSGTKLKDIHLEGETAVLTVTDQLSLATGIQLTAACACLAKTVMGITDAHAVKIRAVTAELGNAPYILMDQSTILLLDETEIQS